MNTEKTGSKFALMIGAPIGLLFNGFALYISLFPLLFPPFYHLMAIENMNIFWHPIIWGIIIPASFLIFLWQDGRKIGNQLKSQDILKTSFRFISLVNFKFFLLLTAIYISGLLIYGTSVTLRATLLSTMIYPFKLLLFFCLATLITSLTIGMLIVKLTEKKAKTLN